MFAIKPRLPAPELAAMLSVLYVTVVSAAVSEVPSPPQANVLFIGDWGFSPPRTRTLDQQKTARAMADYARQSRTAFDAVLVGGDNFKAKLLGPEDPQFREAFEEMYDATALGIPFYAVLGSHDYEYRAAAAELEYSRQHPGSRWKMPDRWYRLDVPSAAPLVTILMLDSDRTELGKDLWQTQTRWMEEELSKPRKSAWTVCLGHHPLFSDGQHGDDKAMQAAWGPVMKKHKVDFYLSGHDHILQHLQRPGWPTTFVISGGGGENTNRPINGNRGPFVRAVHGFAVLRFTEISAKVSLIDESGKVLHAFERDRAAEIRILSSTPSDKSVAAKAGKRQ
jgi:tartrate-resistant acid phosphatase type 5